jgi:2-aminoadipate transaminase
MFERIYAEIAQSQKALSLQYGPTEGFEALKEDIATVMAAESGRVDTGHILVTTGGQQAIDLVTKTYIDPGDTILAEGPAYAGALTTFASYQARVLHLPLDEQGLVVEELPRVLDLLASGGRRPKFLYVVPNFSNPSGVTLPLERRHRLLEVAREHGLLLVEDNPYGLLRFQGELLPSLFSLDRGGGNVLYLGSFSKIISPGIRVGWVVAPPAIYQRLVLGKQAADLCSSPLNQLFVHGFVASGAWSDYVFGLRTLYRLRRDAMLAALSEEFPAGSSWTVPEGGFFVWATLPEGVNTGDLLAKAIDENVAFVRGDAFFMDGQGANSMRLSFSAIPEARIQEGVRRLGGVIRDQLELYKALGL